VKNSPKEGGRRTSITLLLKMKKIVRRAGQKERRL
jgi:hypothetical protein